MAFSYTEKKRVRRSFEKISSVMDLPNLLATQLESYNDFLQMNVDPKKRKNQGLEKVINSIFPIESHSKNARMEFSSYELGEPTFNERECKLKGVTYEASLHINCELFFIDKEICVHSCASCVNKTIVFVSFKNPYKLLFFSLNYLKNLPFWFFFLVYLPNYFPFS